MKSVSLKQILAGKKSLKKQWMQKEFVSKQGRKPAKAEPSIHKDPLFDELVDDTLVYMDTKNAQDMGRSRFVVHEEKEREEKEVSTKDVVSTDKEKVSTDRSKVSTDRSRVSTEKEEVSTDIPDEGTDDQTEGRSATPTIQTHTPTIFGDDETIAQVLLNMSQAKAVSREKEKGVELKDVEETERPRPTSTRSLLTLKPLPKIDPKDKGKKKIEEEDESDTESEGIPEAKKKFKQLARDEEMARKVQEDWEAEEEVKKLAEEEAIKTALSNEYDFIQARIEADRLLALRLQDEERENYLMEEIVTWRLYEACGVCILEFKDGTVIHMLVERKYPLSKELLQRMLDFGLEVEVESTAALDLIRRIAKDVKETLRSDQDLSECLNTSSMKFKESTPKKHEVKQVQQSCLGEDCWELYIPDLVPPSTEMQLNSKFVNNMLPEWGRFVTAVKLNRGLRDSNYDQLTSSNTRNQATFQDGRVVVQNVQDRQNRGQGKNARGGGALDNVEHRTIGNELIQVDKTTPLMKMWMSNITGLSTQCGNYVKDNAVLVVQINVSSVPNDAYMMIYNDMHEPHVQSVSETTRNTVVDNSLTAELATYKEQVELYERRARFELTEREQKIDEQLRIVITDRNIKEENLKKELHSVKLQLASTINHNKSMVEEVTSLKKDFKQKENKYLEEFLDMKALKEKVKIAPPDYSKENYLATFTPQKQLTPEQIFWSQDLIKMKEEALKEQTTASRPIKALTVYPPNTPETLVPRVLPTKSQVKINIFTLIQLFSEFEKTCKKIITPTRLTEGERGFEQTKECYLTEVIPFFKTLKEHFEGIQKALTKEIKEMKDVFEELEAEVDQNVVDRKHDEIERKNLLIAHDNLIADCLSKEVFYVATNSELNVSRFTEMHDAHTIVEARCLELKAELSNLRNKFQKDNHNELVKWFSNLEVNHLNLQLKYQNLKESFENNPSTPAKDTPDFD
ncbi:hypothetical protein Tco_0860564 [Tanacetum coccineum]|uniref:Uncharacterized protein n=1 Tax=Tanacetum coccineum TaxID=301880 RepID=A0ABQ5BIA6_9ASTR